VIVVIIMIVNGIYFYAMQFISQTYLFIYELAE